MAFWGIELKPGESKTYLPDQGRLHISQATLGSSHSTKKSGDSTKKRVFVQCSVGETVPILLCSLIPKKTESCCLDLEFDEESPVVFSVEGTNSVYLTGYRPRRSPSLGRGSVGMYGGDETDSYGEDIDETDTDESTECGTEDEYEDDFIDDEGIEMFRPSPLRNSGVIIEEILDDEKPANRKANQLSDSDGNDDSHQKIVVKGNIASAFESEDEDGFPLSIPKTEDASKITQAKENSNKKIEGGMMEKPEDDTDKVTSLKRKVDAVDRENVPEIEVGGENGRKLKKKKKQRTNKGKALEASVEEMTNGDQNQAIDCNKSDTRIDHEAQHEEEKVDNMNQDPPVRSKPKEKLVNDKELIESSAPSDVLALEKSGKLKKKSSKKAKDRALPGGDNAMAVSSEMATKNQSQSIEDKPSVSEEVGIEKMDLALEPHSKLPDDESLIVNAENTTADIQIAAKKKKKKKSKNHESGTNAEKGESGLVVSQGNTELIEEIKEQKAERQPLKARNFANGLAIEVLSMGKPDGKRASPGNKVSVHYIGKLKNGEIFDSNIGKGPFKFRLGIGQVIKGWDVGLNGMRIGDKRRLTIPPSMGYGAKGAGKIPGNAWLIFDVELVGVH